jgi:hypothetical protein
MEPIQNRKLIDARSEKDAPQPGTAVGERRQSRALGAPDHRIEATADQRRGIRVGFGDSTEDLPSSGHRLGVADPDLQVPLVLLAAPDEGGVQGHHDGLGRRCRFGWRRRR